MLGEKKAKSLSQVNEKVFSPENIEVVYLPFPKDSWGVRCELAQPHSGFEHLRRVYLWPSAAAFMSPHDTKDGLDVCVGLNKSPCYAFLLLIQLF